MALALGIPHPDYLLAQLSSQQFGDWIAYQQIEPFGEWRRDLRSGIVASVVANSVRAKGRPAAKPSDFMPQFEKQKKHDSKGLREKTIDIMTKLVGVQNKKKQRDNG